MCHGGMAICKDICSYLSHIFSCFFINDLVLIYILDESLTDTWFTKSFLFLKIAFYSPDVLGDKEILMKSYLSFVVLIVILGLCLENRSQV